MSERITLVKVLVASPGDVKAERDALAAVVDQINHTIALPQHLLLFVVRWEDDVHPGFGEDAQDVVNQQIDFQSIDLFVGILWKRLGTRTKRAASGTEEEFNRSFALWQERKRPQLMFYFNTMPVAPADLAEHEEYGRVLIFKKRLADIGGLRGDYQGVEDFKDKIRKDLTLFINRFHPQDPGRRGIVVPPARQPRPAAAAQRKGSTFHKLAVSYDHRFAVCALAFSPDDQLLASGDREGAIKLWDLENVARKGKALLKTLLGHTGGISSVAFSTDGGALVSGSDDHDIRLWDLRRSPEEAEQARIQGFRASAYATYAPDGRSEASERNHRLRIVDLITLHVSAEWPAHESDANALAFSPDGSMLASGHRDGALEIWLVEKHERLHSLRTEGAEVQCLAFSPTGDLLASGGYEPGIDVWDVLSGNTVATLPHDVEHIYDLAFSPSGRYLAACGVDGMVAVWERGPD